MNNKESGWAGGAGGVRMVTFLSSGRRREGHAFPLPIERGHGMIGVYDLRARYVHYRAAPTISATKSSRVVSRIPWVQLPLNVNICACTDASANQYYLFDTGLRLDDRR